MQRILYFFVFREYYISHFVIFPVSKFFTYHAAVVIDRSREYVNPMTQPGDSTPFFAYVHVAGVVVWKRLTECQETYIHRRRFFRNFKRRPYFTLPRFIFATRTRASIMSFILNFDEPFFLSVNFIGYSFIFRPALAIL